MLTDFVGPELGGDSEDSLGHRWKDPRAGVGLMCGG